MPRLPNADEITAIDKLPTSHAVYALCGGRDAHAYIAYVGIAANLRRRIIQHLVARDSSVTTGTSAARLEPDHVTEVRWWQQERFTDATDLGAAEIVAFAVLNPALRSRGREPEGAKARAKDKEFLAEMEKLFNGDPTGRLRLPRMRTILEEILGRLQRLEERRERLEAE
jgi:hypothetical protein